MGRWQWPLANARLHSPTALKFYSRSFFDERIDERIYL